jgi:hypothetical protein
MAVSNFTSSEIICPPMSRSFRATVLAIWLATLLGAPVEAKPKPGDVLIADQLANAVMVIDPQTGYRTILSDFNNPEQGPLAFALTGVVVDAKGQIFVTDLFSSPSGAGGLLFRLDSNTGNRIIVSDFGQGTVTGFLYYGFIAGLRDSVVVNLQGFDARTLQTFTEMVRVDVTNDIRVVVSDLENATQGPLLPFVTDLTQQNSGKIFITANNGSSDGVYEVNPRTGVRQPVSDFSDAGEGDLASLDFYAALAVERSGQILAAAFDQTTSSYVLFQINPSTGQRVVLSDFANPAQGQLVGVAGAGAGYLVGVAVEKTGNILVGASGTRNLLLRLDPNTGQRFVLSDSEDLAQGPSFSSIVYIALVPSSAQGGN